MIVTHTILSASQPVLTVQLSAEDTDAQVDLIAKLASHIPNPDFIAAIRLDALSCRAEVDVAARPIDPRRLH